MKHKASLVLMEQLVMILVFAMAATLCLQIFVAADGISRETAQQDRAVRLAQTGAEAVKASSGDLEKAAVLLGTTCTGNHLYVTEEDLRMEIRPITSDIPGLGQAEIFVTVETEQFFSLVIGWQEVAE